jgi:hypothetical protein
MASATSSTNAESTTDVKADIRSSSALTSARKNLKYLWNPNSPTAPERFRTRALLRSLRYLGIFIFWRIVRYAKYALAAAAVSAIGATAFGGAASGFGFILAPPGILASVGIGTIWMAGKYGFRKMGIGEKAVAEGERAKRGVTVDGSWRDVQGPRATPW